MRLSVLFKASAIIILVFAMSLLLSNCGKKSYEIPVLSDLSLAYGKMINDNGWEMGPLQSEDTLSSDRLFMIVSPDIIYTSENISATFSFISSAYAFDQIDTRIQLLEVAIFSDHDFHTSDDIVYTAGDTLNTVFDIGEDEVHGIIYKGLTGKGSLPIDIIYSDIALKLNTGLKEAGKHIFTLHFYFEDGKFFELQAGPVILKP